VLCHTGWEEGGRGCGGRGEQRDGAYYYWHIGPVRFIGLSGEIRREEKSYKSGSDGGRTVKQGWWVVT